MACKVLLVDDSTVARLAIKGQLREFAPELLEAKSGEEALALVDGGLVPDLVFLDLTMPGIGGIETLRGLVSRLPGLKVVVVTADVQAKTIAEVNEAGVWQILRKPANRDQVREVYGRAVGSEK